MPSELPSSSPSSLVRVCDICGDAGFDEMLAICSQCNEGAEHVYCMQTLLDTVPPNWVCEGCKMRERMSNKKDVESVDVQGCLSTHTRLNKTSVSTGCHTSSRSYVKTSDRGNSKAEASSEVMRGRSSHLAAPAGGHSLDPLNVGTFKLPSGTDSWKLASVQPVLNLKTRLNSLDSESLRNVCSSKNILATTSPRRILSKSRSLKSSDEHLSFLLPSRPKNLMRSSSGTARLSSIGDGFKMRKISNQPTNGVNVTEKVSDINTDDKVRDTKGVEKLRILEKAENTKSTLAGLRPNSLANGTEKVNCKPINAGDVKLDSTKAEKSEVLERMGSAKVNLASLTPVPEVCENVLPQMAPVANAISLQISPGDVTFEDGLVNSRNNTTFKVPETSECLGGNVASSIGIPRCYRCKEMGHSLEACPVVQCYDITIGSRQTTHKTNETQVCFGRGRALHNQKLLQSNYVRNVPSSEAHRKDSFKMVHKNSSKQLSKSPWYSGNNGKHRFPARGVERQTSRPAYPAPIINSPHPASTQFWPVDSCHTNQGKSQLHPGTACTYQMAQGTGMPLLPVPNGDLMSTTPFSCYDYYTPEPRAIPDPEILWHGSIKVSSSTSDVSYYHGMQAHPSNRADPKVCEATKILPAQLQVEELQRGVQNDTWPRSFQERPPNSNSIGVFFFPVDMGSHDTFYKPLLDRMLVGDLALRIKLEFAQLLIFPSHLLPEAEQRWDDRMYLWGVFRTNKEKVAPTTENRVIRELGTLCEGVTGNDLGSPHGVGEVIDMDIDMEGGHVVVGVVENLEGGPSNLPVFNEQVNFQSPPLPPGLPPTQPPPPSTPSQSQLDDILKLELRVEHDNCAENTPIQSRNNQDSKISPQGFTHTTNGSSKDLLQTAGKVLFEDGFKELSQMPELIQRDFRNNRCSRPLDCQQHKDGMSSSGRDFCEQPEDRDCLSRRERHIFHSEGVNEVETDKNDFRESVKVERSLLREMGNGRCGFDGRNAAVSIKVKDEESTEVDGDDNFKENREFLDRDVEKPRGGDSRANSHHNQVSTRLPPSRVSNSGASSDSLSGSPPSSSRRSELMGNGMSMDGRREANKSYRRHVSPSSSGSVATENAQALSRSSGDHSQCVWNSSSKDKCCYEQETSEINKGRIILPRIVTSCCSVMGDEHMTNGWQDSPDFVERVETGSQDISTSVYRRALPYLPLFPTEESSTEFEFLGDSAVDQEGGWSDQRWPANPSIPLLDQLERHWNSPLSSSKIGSDGDPSRESCKQSEHVVLDSNPELTLSLPHYRKQGNSWIRIKDDSMSLCDDKVDLTLSLS